MALGGPAAYAQSAGRVAQVFGQNIALSDLSPKPEELAMAQKSYAKLSSEEVAAMLRSSKLSQLIWQRVMEQFAKTHDVEPTAQEVDSLIQAMNAMTAKLPNHNKASAEPPLSMQQDFYRAMVKNWKIDRALYQTYGGTVIFQQANPMEPVGAYRKLLEMHAQRGELTIDDPQLHAKFWEYYLREHPFQTPKDQVDFSVPWWKKK